MSYVLWIVISVGPNVSFTHQRFDNREQCENSARDVMNMPLVREKMDLAKRGAGAFKIDHVCSSGASQHQGAE